jgi:hypothetical protein
MRGADCEIVQPFGESASASLGRVENRANVVQTFTAIRLEGP